jgi:hypothetical protein
VTTGNWNTTGSRLQGDGFPCRLSANVRSLKIYAGVHSVADGFQRMLAKRFPFAVYYLMESDRIDICEVLDCRRDPEWIVKRLGSSRTQ